MKKQTKHSGGFSDNLKLSLNLKRVQENTFCETNKNLLKNEPKVTHKKLTHNNSGYISTILTVLMMMTIIASGNASLCDDYPNDGPPGGETGCACSNEKTDAEQSVFIYSGPGCVIDCSMFYNVKSNSSLTATTCDCVDNYTWQNSAQNYSCIPQCANLNNTDPNNLVAYKISTEQAKIIGRYSAGQFACYCKTGYSWQIQGNISLCKLNLNCSSINYSTGMLDSPTSCRCYSLYKWNSTTSTCDIDCTKILNADTSSTAAVPPAGQCTCQQKFHFAKYIPQCVIDCSQVANSVRVNVNISECRCKSKYYWVSSNNSCVLNCSATNVPNSNGTSSADGSSCICKNSTIYYWVPSTSECRLNCTAVPNSLGILSSTTSCRCKPSSSWMSSQSTCKLVCATVRNNNGTVNDTTCACKQGYSWDPSSYLCLPTIM